MVCSRCGAEIAEGSGNCNNCGIKVKKNDKQTTRTKKYVQSAAKPRLKKAGEKQPETQLGFKNASIQEEEEKKARESADAKERNRKLVDEARAEAKTVQEQQAEVLTEGQESREPEAQPVHIDAVEEINGVTDPSEIPCPSADEAESGEEKGIPAEESLTSDMPCAPAAGAGKEDTASVLPAESEQEDEFLFASEPPAEPGIIISQMIHEADDDGFEYINPIEEYIPEDVFDEPDFPEEPDYDEPLVAENGAPTYQEVPLVTDNEKGYNAEDDGGSTDVKADAGIPESEEGEEQHMDAGMSEAAVRPLPAGEPAPVQESAQPVEQETAEGYKAEPENGNKEEPKGTAAQKPSKKGKYTQSAKKESKIAASEEKKPDEKPVEEKRVAVPEENTEQRPEPVRTVPAEKEWKNVPAGEKKENRKEPEKAVAPVQQDAGKHEEKQRPAETTVETPKKKQPEKGEAEKAREKESLWSSFIGKIKKLLAYPTPDKKEEADCEKDFNADGYYDDATSSIPPEAAKQDYRQLGLFILWTVIAILCILYFIHLLVD